MVLFNVDNVSFILIHNSAISVLLGEAWKALPVEERESYSTRAKVMADEQKKIHPDCWKRKKTTMSSKQQQQQRHQQHTIAESSPHTTQANSQTILRPQLHVAAP